MGLILSCLEWILNCFYDDRDNRARDLENIARRLHFIKGRPGSLDDFADLDELLDDLHKITCRRRTRLARIKENYINDISKYRYDLKLKIRKPNEKRNVKRTSSNKSSKKSEQFKQKQNPNKACYLSNNHTIESNNATDQLKHKIGEHELWSATRISDTNECANYKTEHFSQDHGSSSQIEPETLARNDTYQYSKPTERESQKTINILDDKQRKVEAISNIHKGDLINVFNPAIYFATDDQYSEQNEQEIQINKDMKILNYVKRKMEALKPNIYTFEGCESDNRFYELNETINRLIISLDRIESIENDIRQKKMSYLKELYQLEDSLLERANYSSVNNSSATNIHQKESDISKSYNADHALEIQLFSNHRKDLIQIEPETPSKDYSIDQYLEQTKQEIQINKDMQILSYSECNMEANFSVHTRESKLIYSCNMSVPKVEHFLKDGRNSHQTDPEPPATDQYSEQTDQENQINKDTKTLNDVERKMKALKPKIDTFEGCESDNRFYELDETINRLIISLDRIESIEKVIRQKKISYLKELHQLGDRLLERANYSSVNNLSTSTGADGVGQTGPGSLERRGPLVLRAKHHSTRKMKNIHLAGTNIIKRLKIRKNKLKFRRRMKKNMF